MVTFIKMLLYCQKPWSITAKVALRVQEVVWLLRSLEFLPAVDMFIFSVFVGTTFRTKGHIFYLWISQEFVSSQASLYTQWLTFGLHLQAMLMNHFFLINFVNALVFRTTYVCPLLHNWILISFYWHWFWEPAIIHSHPQHLCHGRHHLLLRWHIGWI